QRDRGGHNRFRRQGSWPTRSKGGARDETACEKGHHSFPAQKSQVKSPDDLYSPTGDADRFRLASAEKLKRSRKSGTRQAHEKDNRQARRLRSERQHVFRRIGAASENFLRSIRHHGQGWGGTRCDS